MKYYTKEQMLEKYGSLEKVHWFWISAYQKLSEEFIREFQDIVNWDFISEYQKLSEEFAKEFNLTTQLEIQDLHKKINNKENAIEYAIKHELPIDENYLYAYRNFKGIFSPYGTYQLRKYYRDWHCDPRENVKNSYGFGIWGNPSEGDCLVRVKLEDFVIDTCENTKARVWGFEILERY